MTRSQTFLLGSALWLGGIGVFAGFAYAMNRPLEIPAPEPVSAPVQLTAASVPAPPAYEHVVTLAPIEIVGHVPKALHFPAQTVAPAAVTPVDVMAPSNNPQLHCGNWRPLEQGGSESTVRECQ